MKQICKIFENFIFPYIMEIFITNFLNFLNITDPIYPNKLFIFIFCIYLVFSNLFLIRRLKHCNYLVDK